MPRRTAIGVDHNRVSLLTAVMDKICGIHLGSSDIFLNVAGGVKVDETAIDLGIVSAMASSFLDRPIAAGTVVFGEVGLTGEIRGISQTEIRIREAARMGFTRCILPRTQTREGLHGEADRTDPDRFPEGTDGTSLLTADSRCKNLSTVCLDIKK